MRIMVFYLWIFGTDCDCVGGLRGLGMKVKLLLNCDFTSIKWVGFGLFCCDVKVRGVGTLPMYVCMYVCRIVIFRLVY